MTRTNFETLEVYRRSEELADLVWGVVIGWGPFAKSTVGKQLVRAADSAPANVAEGTGRGTVKDKQHFVRVARGSVYETKNWLRRAYRRSLLTDEQVGALKPHVDALAPMLNAYLRSIR
jgi:four helix bundle protein